MLLFDSAAHDAGLVTCLFTKMLKVAYPKTTVPFIQKELCNSATCLTRPVFITECNPHGDCNGLQLQTAAESAFATGEAFKGIKTLRSKHGGVMTIFLNSHHVLKCFIPFITLFI